jgi:pimeloyl-ACP methyl ester carboxylesterase
MEGEYNNAEKIRRVHARLMVIQGVDDKFIDIEKNGAVVYNNANPPKQFIRVPGADHSTVPVAFGEANYISVVGSFIVTPFPPD